MTQPIKLSFNIWSTAPFEQEEKFANLPDFQKSLIANLQSVLSANFTRVSFELENDDESSTLTIHAVDHACGSNLNLVMPFDKNSPISIRSFDSDNKTAYHADKKGQLFHDIIAELENGIQKTRDMSSMAADEMLRRVEGFREIHKMIVNSLANRP